MLLFTCKLKEENIDYTNIKVKTVLSEIPTFHIKFNNLYSLHITYSCMDKHRSYFCFGYLLLFLAPVLVTTVTLKYHSNTPSSSDRVTVTAGTATRFTCTASFSRPQATIDWYIEGYDTPKQSSTSPTFDLFATEADHNRRIYCKAYNNIQTEAHGVLSEKPVLYVQGKKDL